MRSEHNQMDATNLTIVLGPNLVKSSSPLADVAMAGFSAKEPTLGTVLRTCITRYYECFEDVPDRADVVVPAPEADEDSLASLATFEIVDADEDEIDDAMLVMPLGPAAPAAPAATVPASAAPGAPYQVRKRKSMPGSNSRTSTLSAARSSLAPSDTLRGTVKSRSRSVISVERGGSIAIGRGGAGTVRGKSAGAGVSAMGVTASGFFTSPDAPPVPPMPR
jgi:Rho GTPase-activating protein 1